MLKNKINSLQLGSLLFMLGMAPFIGIAIFTLIQMGGVDAYLSVLLGGIFGFILLFCIFIIGEYEPDLTLSEKLKKIYGKEIGSFFNLILIITFSIMSISIIFNLSNFIVSQFLSETPPLIIGIIFTILIAYLTSKGIETISRVSLILFGINLVLIMITVVGLLPKANIDNLKPFLEFGISRPLSGSVYFILSNVTPLMTLLMVPKNAIVDKKNLKKTLSIFYALMILFAFLAIGLTISNLGIHLSSLYQYPEYIVLKRISFFNFLDRIENVVTSQWIFYLFIASSFLIYSVTHCIANKGLWQTKVFPFIIAFIILLLSQMIFQNNTIFNTYSLKVMPILRIPLLAIIILTTIIVCFKKKWA